MGFKRIGKAIALLLLVVVVCSVFGCGVVKTDEPTEFTVTIHNVTSESFTAWADDTTGDKVVTVKIGETITIPQIKYDTMTAAEIDNRNNDFDGWYYKNKNGAEVKLNVATAFTLENLNVDKYEITLYAKLLATSLGPF